MMAIGKELEIPWADIVDHTSFAYRDGLERWSGGELLKASLVRCGLRQPLLLRPVAEGLQIIAGFRRFALWRQAGLSPSIRAKIVEGEPRDLFLAAVEEHAGQDSNLRERIRAIRVALGLGWSMEEIAGNLLPALGFSPQPHLVKQYLKLAELPSMLLDVFVEKNFSLRRCLPFCHLPPEEALVIANLARHLRLGGRQIEQVSMWLLEISRRENLSLTQLAKELHLFVFPEGLAAQGAEFAAETLQRLEARRFPETWRRRQQIEHLCHTLELPGVAIHWDQNFTRDTLDLSFSLRQCSDLERFLQLLERAETQAQLQRILEHL
jgi:hypothetical protein